MTCSARTQRLAGGATYRYCWFCDRLTIVHGECCTVCEAPRRVTAGAIFVCDVEIDVAAFESVVTYKVLG